LQLAEPHNVGKVEIVNGNNDNKRGKLHKAMVIKLLIVFLFFKEATLVLLLHFTPTNLLIGL